MKDKISSQYKGAVEAFYILLLSHWVGVLSAAHLTVHHTAGSLPCWCPSQPVLGCYPLAHEAQTPERSAPGGTGGCRARRAGDTFAEMQGRRGGVGGGHVGGGRQGWAED